MGLAIDPRAPLAGEVRRVALEQVDRALAEISRGGLDPEFAVHQVRKRCKKLRALLRLVRDPLGAHYRREQRWYRDTARLLSGLRDTHQGRATLASLAPEADPAALLPDDARAGGAPLPADQLLAACAGRFREGRVRVGNWPLEGVDISALLQGGFRRTYRQGRRDLQAARKQPTAAALHQWRKAAKYHGYQLKILRKAWPLPLRAQYREVLRLGEYLGDHHDLQALAGRLPSLAGEPGTETRERLRRRQRKLQRQALRLGRRIYAERPTALCRRIERCWRVAAGR
jgi:CHAD domain-containing protein